VDRGELLRRGRPVGALRARRVLQQLLDAGDADLEEFVEVARGDAEESQPLEQRHGGVLGLGEHALVELELRELAVDQPPLGRLR